MKNLSFSFSALLFLTTTCLAQDYLLDSDLTIASHKRKSSPVSFQKANAENKSTVIGYIFRPGDHDPYKGMDDKILIYNGLPECKESKVDLEEVFQHSEGSEAIDFILYDYKSSAQSKKAQDQSRVTVPWDPSYDPSAGYMTVDAKMQDLARVMAPECLPTSFRYIYVGSKRYREAKTGDKAWEK